MGSKGPSHTNLLWLFLGALVVIFILFWGISKWELDITKKKQREHKFYDVTNRDFSLFLWQNPSFMKQNREFSSGYLPHYHSNDFTLFPDQADEDVVAPPDILFRYHVWSRLIGDSLANRPIMEKEFALFLDQNHLWLPLFWLKAPEGYVELVRKIKSEPSNNDLSALPFDILPYKVRLAYQGWKNYVFEWNAILTQEIAKNKMAEFLERYPYYGRSYWKNILEKETPQYLISFKEGSSYTGNPEAILSDEELSIFLKVALYNFSHSTQTQITQK